MSKPDEILYVAHKTILEKIVKSGFVQQFISEPQYYVFDQYPQLYLQFLEQTQEKSIGGMVKPFFEFNPHRLKDVGFTKEVIKRLKVEGDLKYIIESCGEERFIHDLPLMKNLLNNFQSSLTIYGFKAIKSNEQLRQMCYDLDVFCIHWFDLKAPNDDDLIKNLLIKVPTNFNDLEPEQKNNKEYALLALKGSLDNNYTAKSIYNEIASQLKEDTEVALLAAQCKIIDQPIKALQYPQVLTTLLNSVYKSDIELNRQSSKYANVDLEKISKIDNTIFSKAETMYEFLSWLNQNKTSIKKQHDNYSLVYKIIKSSSKYNDYIKEQFNKEESCWNRGNIGKTKHYNNQFFERFFTEDIESMCNEMKNYTMALKLSKDLTAKEKTKTKIKI